MFLQVRWRPLVVAACWLWGIGRPIPAPGAEAGVVSTDNLAASVPLLSASRAAGSDAADGAKTQAAQPSVLPAETVKAKGMQTPVSEPDATQSITRIESGEIERRQAASVFELLDGVAGAGVNGGPRASGMSFNIRGYTDSEDVAVKVDGAVKGFEKYRYGGTFIEPDLIKSVEVQRGPQIESGAGSLGGTVLATTKDATDLLQPGRSFGARVRLGYGSVDDERHRFAAVYGRPNDDVDLLLAVTRRRSDDIGLPGGKELEHSSAALDSRLLKATWLPGGDWSASFSFTDYTDKGLQPFDTTSNLAGLFGLVVREARDRTAALTLRYADDAGRHDWHLTLARGTTRVEDWSLNSRTTNDYAYRIDTIDAGGRQQLLRATWLGLPAELQVKAGAQLGRNERRVTSFGSATSQPDGFYGAQPPGIKRSRGLYVEPQLSWGRLNVAAGLRRDLYEIEARSQTAAKLRSQDEDTSVGYGQTSPHVSVSLDLVPQQWTLFANTARSFRPPLIDEIYTDSGYGRCNDNVLSFGWKVPGYPRTRSLTNVYGPKSGICGSRYEAEESRTVEWGLSTSQRDVLGRNSQLAARATFFRNRTDHLLESLSFVPGGSGQTWQPGWEHRRGQELESTAAWRLAGTSSVFARLSYSRIRGTRYDGDVHEDLYTAPGDTTSASVGWRGRKTEASLRWQRVAARRVLKTDQYGRESIGHQDGYHLLGATFRTELTPHLELQVSGENLENAGYHLNDGWGGGQGTQAPGRNLRVSLTARY
jgi:hemoglobin/transferrin/lactoferrin receptor protein